MMKVKGIFAVSLIAMVAVVAGTHTSNAVAAIASKGYVDQVAATHVQSSKQTPNAILTTDDDGNVQATTQITQSQVDGLTGALNAKADTTDIPTVNNGQLTINVNGTPHSFTANQAGGTTVDIDIPDEVDFSGLSGSTTGGGNVVTNVTQTDGKVSAFKGITAEVASNRVTSANFDSNTNNDTKYPTVKAVADAIADVEKKIPAAITVDSALSSTSTNPVQNKVINTALAGKQATLTSTQLNAVNSGITSTKVSTYDGYNEKITAAQNAANAKVATAQGPGNANKAVITNSSGNVTTGQIASGMIADGTIVNADIAADAEIATSKISGLGTLATKNAVTSAEITDGTITNADIAADAKIATSKISGLAKVATSGSYGDLTGTPTIPTVNNATLTIQKNGDTVDTFTANASANKTINITVPTKTSELDNDSGFVTSANLPVATESALGGVKSGGDITVDTSGAVTVKSADRADSATTATTAKFATLDAEGNDIISTYAKKSDIPTASDILTTTTVTSSGTGAVLTGVSVEDGKVTLQKGNVQIPSGGQNATSYVSIWVE